MPSWVQDGGLEAWIERLKDPAIRARVAAEMRDAHPNGDNPLHVAGANGTLFLGFKSDQLKPLVGQTLADAARALGTTPEDTAMDLVVEDGSRVDVAYFGTPALWSVRLDLAYTLVLLHDPGTAAAAEAAAAERPQQMPAGTPLDAVQTYVRALLQQEQQGASGRWTKATATARDAVERAYGRKPGEGPSGALRLGGMFG